MTTAKYWILWHFAPFLLAPEWARKGPYRVASKKRGARVVNINYKFKYTI